MGPLVHIWSWLQELGPGRALEWSEVKAWSDMTGVRPSPDECAALIRMSNLFVNEYRRGCYEKDALPAPDVQEVIFNG
jgi:hypothetical protein